MKFNKKPRQKGLIIIGYQGIGKSTYATSWNKTIDFESSNFKINGDRPDDWHIIYCKQAVELAKQGYIVLTSSHKEVVDEFIKYVNSNDYEIVIVSPHCKLKREWCKKLHDRWLEDETNKNYCAYTNADNYFIESIKELSNQSIFSCIFITSMDYNFAKIVEGICSIYNINCYVNDPII